MVEYIVNKEEEGQTLEKYVKKVLPNVPLSFIYKLFRKKDIKINGHPEDKKVKVSCGDTVRIYITDQQLEDFSTSEKEVRPSDELVKYIIYEDENILLINKPRGLLVQKDKPNVKALDDMVLSYLAYKGEYDKEQKAFTPGPCHRLDRNTQGIVIFGKNIATLQYLMSIMQDKSKIEKHYLALVKGNILEKGKVDVPLKKVTDKSLVKVASIKDGGKKAVTLYEPVKNYKECCLLSLTLLTGRTHQIRVHMAYIGHPVIGDSKYGDFTLNKEFENKYHFVNQFLVANYVKFDQLDYPLTYLNGKKFEVEMDNDMFQILKVI